jgi:hypothetical protein
MSQDTKKALTGTKYRIGIAHRELSDGARQKRSFSGITLREPCNERPFGLVRSNGLLR